MTAATCTNHGSEGCPVCRPPRRIERSHNRPGLSSVAYRLGTFGAFREAMLTDLSTDKDLQALATRQPDDHAISFVEMWAVIADVLSFYQERYANEAWLGTATSEAAVQRLCELIGYRPRPGLAATSWLSFTLDPGPAVEIPAGQRVQSVPVASETPQVFETLAPLTADHRLNAISAHLTASPGAALAEGTTASMLDRDAAPQLAAALNPGDRVVVFDASRSGDFQIEAIERHPDRMVVRWATPITGTFTAAAVRRYRRTLPVFGRQAPAQWMKPAEIASAAGGFSWSLEDTDDTIAAGAPLDLEGEPNVAVGAELLVTAPGVAPTVAKVTAVTAATATVGPVTAAVTRLTVATPGGGTLPALAADTVRVYLLDGPQLRFWAQDYPVALLGVDEADVFVPGFRLPDEDGVPAVEVGRRIEGDEWVAGGALRTDEIDRDRPVILTAAADSADANPPLLATVRDDPAVEPSTAAVGDFCHLRLPLALTGAWTVAVAELTMAGNVAAASHGETTEEVVGDGDAALAFQHFPLGSKPLTYLPPAAGTTPDSTARVFVDGVERTQVPTLYGQEPDAPVYTVRHLPNGTAEIRTGDGRSGARLPTGTGNVVARYRTGSGLEGRVRADQLTTLLGAPTGVAKATNPLPAEGGADPDDPARLRRDGPRSVRTLGRAVSLRDLEDAAIETGLVAKAWATWVWDGYERSAHLTVAAQAGGTLSDLTVLASAVDAVRNPSYRLWLGEAVDVPIRIEARLAIAPGMQDPEPVRVDARDRLTAALAFDAVELVRPVNLSDLVALLAGTPGVEGVDVDRLEFRDTTAFSAAELAERGVALRADGTVHPVQPRLRLLGARPDLAQPGAVLPAEYPVVANATQDLLITGGLT